MSAAVRFALVLALVSTFTFVKTWPQNNADAELYRQRQRQAASGQDRNIPRNQPFQSSYNSDQPGLSQARRDDSTSKIGLWDQFGNNVTNIHAQTIGIDSQETVNRGRQGTSEAPWFNSSTQRTVSNNSHSHQDMVPAIRTSELHGQNSTTRSDPRTSTTRSVPRIPACNASSASRTNKQGQSAGARSPELHAVSRGNRRVATHSASQKAQALSNSNESLDKSEESRFQTNFPKVSFSENNHRLQEENIKNKSRTVVFQSRTQPLLNLTGNNDNFRENISTVKNFQNTSNISMNNSSTLSVQGRIVTPVIIRGTRPDISTDVREWEGIAAATAGPSSSEFKGDSATSAEASGGAIVFPDAKFKPRLTGNKAPECAKGTTFCTEAENYPLPQLSSILQNEINYKEYFGVDKEEAVTDDEIRQRIGPVDGDPLCRSQEKLIFPKIAQNKDDEWMFVVNLDKDYVQGVRIEVCEKEASPCQLSEGFPPGYTTYCRQKYIYRKLLAVGDDGKPAPDSFKLPSCCACYYRKTSIGNRILSANSSAISKPQG
ncbi:uncharacterized protein [Anabrus simplex]|uniref:uncharacterized protein isoform X2 n=1 Tax=Anabrus simplex TaxID=316456 RepID=UPI0035A27218